MEPDAKYYPIFRYHCRPPCYMDGHYFPTPVTKISPELNSNGKHSLGCWSSGGSHPARFVRKDVSEAFLIRTRNGFNCNGASPQFASFLQGSFSRIAWFSLLEPLGV